MPPLKERNNMAFEDRYPADITAAAYNRTLKGISYAQFLDYTNSYGLQAAVEKSNRVAKMPNPTSRSTGEAWGPVSMYG